MTTEQMREMLVWATNGHLMVCAITDKPKDEKLAKQIVATAFEVVELMVLLQDKLGGK